MKNKLSGFESYILNARDRFLVREALANNSLAFATLMTLYQKRVEAVGMRFFHNVSETEDFVQDVFIKVFKNLNTFKGESRFSTWITRIAIREAINHKKSRKTQEYDSLEENSEIFSLYDTPEKAHFKSLVKKAVDEAVNELPQNYAQCLELYFFAGMKYEDISETTGIPVNTVKSHIYRAKKLLSHRLEELNEK